MLQSVPPRRIVLFLVFFTILLMPFHSGTSQLAAQSGFAENAGSKPGTALLQQARDTGEISVIVHFAASFSAEAIESRPQRAAQLTAVAVVRDGLLARQQQAVLQLNRTYRYIPHVAITTNAAGLEALLADEQVLGVYADLTASRQMDVSNGIIGSPAVWNSGYTGTGTVVAVLDDGFDSEHPHFSGRVAGEACFSTNAGGRTSLCPEGQPEVIGEGAAGACANCDHGIHVAGIVTGSGTNAGRDIKGVAKDAGVLGIQVFGVNENNETDARFSDIIKGLEWTLDQKIEENLNVVAANMSLGGGRFFNICDASLPALKDIADLLTQANIAVIAASGNDGFTDSMSIPACISSIISVGNTETGKYAGTVLDRVRSTSNTAPFLDLFAPGQIIESAVNNAAYGAKGGTSMAAPHVAGAWALIRQKYPNAPVVTVLQMLQDTGVQITDTRNNINLTFSRIQADDAMLGAPVISAGLSHTSFRATANSSYSLSLTLQNTGERMLQAQLTDVPGGGSLRMAAHPHHALQQSANRQGVLPAGGEASLSGNRLTHHISGLSGTPLHGLHAGLPHEPQQCAMPVAPPFWNSRSGVLDYIWTNDPLGNLYGSNLRGNEAFAQHFPIAEPILLKGIDVLIGRKAGSAGTALFQVLDFNSKSVLKSVSVPMDELPDGFSRSHIPFPEPLTADADILVVLDVTGFDTHDPPAYDFALLSSIIGDISAPAEPTQIRDESGWRTGFMHEIGFFLCTDTQPGFTISYTATSANIAENEAEQIQLTLNMGDVNPGTYERTLQIYSNDPLNPVYEIPVTVQVEESFAGTFEGPDEAWRFVGSPVAGATYAELLAPVWTQGSAGSDAPSGDPTVLFYNGSAFVPVADLAEEMPAGAGLAVYFFGADNISQPDVITWPKVLPLNGFEHPGDVDVSPLLNQGTEVFTLLGNPFSEPISYDGFIPPALPGSSGIGDVIYVYDHNFNPDPFAEPDQSGGLAAGGGYRAWNGLAGSLAGGEIGAFQSFFVYSTTTGGASLTIPQTARVPAGGETRPQSDPVLQLAARVNGREADDLWLSFSDTGSFSRNPKDAVMLWPLDYAPFLVLYTLPQADADADTAPDALTIKNLPSETDESISLPLFIQAWQPGTTGWQPLSGDAEMKWLHTETLPENHDFVLEDLHTGTRINLRDNPAYSFYLDMGAGGRTAALPPDPRQNKTLKKVVVPAAGLTAEGARFLLHIDPQPLSDTETPSDLPGEVQLSQNYPNPFNPATVISYALPAPADVRLEVFNVQGQRVAVLQQGRQAAGMHQVQFDASALSSGLYLYRLQTGETAITRKMMFLK